MITQKEIIRCKKFIELNGGEFLESETEHDKEKNILSEEYAFSGFGIVFDYEQNTITFMGEQGEFKVLNINYYELLGYMVQMSLLGIGLKRIFD